MCGGVWGGGCIEEVRAGGVSGGSWGGLRVYGGRFRAGPVPGWGCGVERTNPRVWGCLGVGCGVYRGDQRCGGVWSGGAGCVGEAGGLGVVCIEIREWGVPVGWVWGV